MKEEIYYTDYPNEPIGENNPYYCCVYCKRSDPEINGRLEGHSEGCEYRIEKEKSVGTKGMSFNPGSKKVVNLPITVPSGKYCWEYDGVICEFFDNEGGFPSCDLNFDPADQKKSKNGVLKDPKCAALKEATA